MRWVVKECHFRAKNERRDKKLSGSNIGSKWSFQGSHCLARDSPWNLVPHSHCLHSPGHFWFHVLGEKRERQFLKQKEVHLGGSWPGWEHRTFLPPHLQHISKNREKQGSAQALLPTMSSELPIPTSRAHALA